MLAVEWIRPAVPLARNVAIAPEGHQRTRPRLDAEPGHQCQVTAGGLPHYKKFVGIDAKKFRSAFAHPIAGIAHVVNDRRQFDLRRQSVINGNDDVSGVEQRLQQGAGFRCHLPISHHQRAAVDENDHRSDRVTGQPMHIRL